MLLVRRSIEELTVVVADALLLPVFVSDSVDVTLAVAVRVPPAVGVTSTETWRLLNAATLVQVQVTCWDTALQLPLKFALKVRMVEEAGASNTAETLFAVLLLLLVTVMV